MSEPTTATASPAVSQLAYFWGAQNDATKLIFNQLYQEAPELVLRVLTQGQLQPDPGHTSIDQIVAPAGEDALFNQPGVSVMDVVVNPPFPKANEAFTITWKRSVQGGIPEHSNAVQIVNMDGTVVDERPVARGAGAHGASDEQTENFDGLPNGTYNVNIWANLEGSDGAAVPTARGMRGQGGAQLYVGETRESQVAQQIPAAGNIMNGVSSARYVMEQIAALEEGRDDSTLDEQFRAGLSEAVADVTVDSLGDGFKAELQRVDSMLRRPIFWGPERESGAVHGLVQRINGIMQIDAASNPGDVGFAVIQIVDELYEATARRRPRPRGRRRRRLPCAAPAVIGAGAPVSGS